MWPGLDRCRRVVRRLAAKSFASARMHTSRRMHRRQMLIIAALVLGLNTLSFARGDFQEC
jgi:hypothetical protein